MTSPVLSLTRFRELAAAYGSDVERWPAQEREPARQLLATSEEARDTLMSEAPFDALLRAAPPPALTPELQRRLAGIPNELPRIRPKVLGRRLWAPALGWAAAAGVGLWLGVSAAQPEDTTSASAETAERMQSSEDPADGEVLVSEVLALASGSMTDLEELP